jgi:Spy/CpxP family protein refolding chaperone
MRRSAVVIGRLVFVLALAGTTGAPLSAQRGPPGRMGQQQDRTELERRVRARFGEMVKQRLGLSDEQAQRLNETVMSFQQDRMSLWREEQAVRKRVEALLLESGDNQAEARELLQRMQELRMQEARLWQTEQDKLLEVLTPEQVLRFQAMREEMGQRIRRLRGGGPGGGPGIGPGMAPGMDLDLLPER